MTTTTHAATRMMKPIIPKGLEATLFNAVKNASITGCMSIFLLGKAQFVNQLDTTLASHY